jgi:hypothetical protein|nr:MAG TPA: hypothetical protein [Caudoviricetes sp.]
MSKALEVARELVRQLEEAERKNKVELSTLAPGDVFEIGKNDFIVLEQIGAEVKIISKNFMAKNVVYDETSRDYNKSNLKEMIEDKIQPIIESEVGENNLVEHTVELTSVDMQHEFDDCKCKVRPITFDEARKYNNLLPNKDLDDWWWTCTPWSTEERGCSYSIAVVSSAGNFYRSSCYCGRGVRPVCILKSNIFVSKKGE